MTKEGIAALAKRQKEMEEGEKVKASTLNRNVLLKPEGNAGAYTTKSNRADRQLIVSKKEEPKTYGAIDI